MDDMTNVQAGSHYRVKQTIGETSPLRAGTVVTVREVVPADVPGAHDNSGECVVVEWTELGIHEGTDWERTTGPVNRACAIPAHEFDTLFEAE
jgi:DNA polymerase III alpha subunit (gram-positive type)